MCGPKTREIALCSIEPSEQRQDIREKKVRKRERDREREREELCVFVRDKE